MGTCSKFVFFVLILLLSAALGLWLAVSFSLPSNAANRTMAGLQHPVTVSLDAWQRPYVAAQTLGDALQTQGWLHASHRLWQMELMRRAGAGRLSELFGASTLPSDKELWRMGVPQLAQRLQSNAGTDTLVRIDRYLAGVNQAIAELRFLPPEFLLLRAPRPVWKRSDVFAVSALMALQSANNMDNELLRLGIASMVDAELFEAFMTEGEARSDYPFIISASANTQGVFEAADRLAVLDPLHNALMPRLGFGSNGWVVSAQRSSSGAPLFAFDSHDALGAPTLFYEVHLFFGERKQLRGWSVAGMPGVINGYNESIAWGFTNIGDTQDIFLERRSAEDPLLFRNGDQWHKAKIETATIPVKGSAAETVTIVHTHNGPLISDDPPLSLAWTVHRLPSPNLDSLLQMNLATDWQSFRRALEKFPAPTLNATYADIHGTIAFRTAGVLPQRGAGVGLVPRDGSDPAQQWQGLVEPGRMPERTNPASGFLAAANSRVNAPGDGVLVSADNAAPYRMARISQVLGEDGSFSADDMRTLQMDRKDAQAQMLLPTMLAALASAMATTADVDKVTTAAEKAPAAVPSIQALTKSYENSEAPRDGRYLDAMQALHAWVANPQATPDSSAALIFQQWYMELAAEVFAEKLRDEWPRLQRRSYVLNHALDYLILEGHDSAWWRGQQSQLIGAALQRSVSKLAAQFGDDVSAWRLDQALHVRIRHELSGALPLLDRVLNLPEAHWGGGPSTVGRARYNYNEPFTVNAGATVRVVAEMSSPPAVRAVIAGGQSGHFMSEHYADQYQGWLDGALYPIANDPMQAGIPKLRFHPVGNAKNGSDRVSASLP